MKKVLFVIPYMHEGGAQRALSNIQKKLSAFYEIDTLVNCEENRAYPNTGGVISLHIDKKPRTASPLFQFMAFVKRVRCLKKLKRAGGYSACISFVDSANIANIITKGCSKTSVKTIISVRTSISEKALRLPQYKYIVKPLARLLYKKADVVVAVSEELRYELIKDLKLDESHVISIINGFDKEELLSQAVENIDSSVEKRIKNTKVIFTAGRLDVVKNQWHLIRAFSAVRKEIPDSVLLIAGSGKLMDYLQETVKSLNLDDNVIFLGFEKNVYRYLRKSDVFVLPSKIEGFPNSLGEALCLGVPCIATDFRTGAREILAPELLFDKQCITKAVECEYGVISPMCSGTMYKNNEPLEEAEIELAGAMISLLKDKELNERYKIKSDERGKNLDIQNIVKKWVEVIEG